MVSVIAQERLLGIALGGVMAAAITFEERKCIYRSISTNQKHVAVQSQEMVERKSCSNLAHLWNTTIDRTLGSVISFLSSRGW